MKLVKGRNRPLQRDSSYKVAVAMPTPINRIVHFDPLIFLQGGFARGVIEYEPFPSRQAEFGRNTAIKKFLTYPEWQNYTHLFFLDADTWPENSFAIERLLSHGKPFVAGITPIVRPDNNWGVLDYWSAIPLPINGGENKPLHLDGELPKGLFKAAMTGGTTMLIRRDVLEKLTPPYQQCIYNADITDYVKSEDYYFSEKIREAGFDLWIDPTVICHHSHQFDLLNFYKWMQRHKKPDSVDMKPFIDDIYQLALMHAGDIGAVGALAHRILDKIKELWNL